VSLVKRRCLTCNGQKRIWLGGSDYMDCPDCEAMGWVEAHRVALGPMGILYVRDFSNRSRELVTVTESTETISPGAAR